MKNKFGIKVVFARHIYIEYTAKYIHFINYNYLDKNKWSYLLYTRLY